MAPMVSKSADREISPHPPRLAPGEQHQHPCDDEIETQQYPENAQLAAIEQTALKVRVPELLNPQASQAETELPDASLPEDEDIGSTRLNLHKWADGRAGLNLGDGITLGNGQMRLNIYDWRTSATKFIVENNPTGNPKCDLDAVITESDNIRVDFKATTDYPDGVMGVLGAIKAIFTAPEEIGMRNIETGFAPAYRESKNPNRDSYFIKWTTPWETFGCRVSWMKAEEDSQSIRFKFVNGKNAGPEEQLMVTVDENDRFYQQISDNDPNTYGKWMALPVRIWLRTQWLVAITGDVDNGLFGKLSVGGNYPSSIKKRNKGRKQSKKLPKRARESFKAEGNSEGEKSNASVAPSPEPLVVGQENTMETMGSHEVKEESTQQELTKRVSTLRIDTQKSNRRSKEKGRGECTPDLSGSSVSPSDSGKKDADEFTGRPGNQRELLPGVQDIARQDVATEQQLAAVADQQTVNASRFPKPSDLTTPLSSSFETARTHLSPNTPFPSSALSCYFTPTTIPWKEYAVDGEDGVHAEENEPAEISDRLSLTPRGDEVGLLGSVSNNRDEVCFSDPEEYLGGHKAQQPVLRRSESFDVASLGKFKGQETASSFPTADHPLSSLASSNSSTTGSVGVESDESSSDEAAQPDDQTPAEPSRRGKKSAYKRKRQEKRRHKRLMKRQQEHSEQEHSADVSRPVSNASSKGDGLEGRSPSPPESFEDEDPTPTAVQFGNIGTPSPEPQLDLGRIAILCEKQGCQVHCGLGDGVSVVCPKCGPFSEVRYCGKDHLWEDVKVHWLVCGTRPVYQQQPLAGSIPYDVLVGPPMLPSLHQWDTPERHRQAVWFSSARDRGDYFVFAEWDDLVKAADAPGSHVGLRCSPRVAHIVRFEDAKEKDRFRRCLAVCLFSAVEHPALVDYVYRLVRDWMRAHNLWASDKDMDSMLRYQMGLEMGSTLDESRLGLRHACETEWVGANRRHCEDLTCASERRPTLLGYQCMGLGFRRVCEYLESNYWILRAHRATHPSVSDVVARTCGGGFSEVLSMDRRTFRRGEGWDGAGTGPMELEMP
ncbi:uncharacterized protein PGRI_064390 [Penicillium griseofulvum]|uniref:Uncharacterized protein n=1 Tax=Penicillium patulum TaxID=5078 RepID=A0A135LPH4_PENPA|nr:uncharacterized protein PGRI_064390 [Penicillium griseofulvum]KXG50867.1 hypothetical protein PGRI_064390 [Penicillium griseofulvum]